MSLYARDPAVSRRRRLIFRVSLSIVGPAPSGSILPSLAVVCNPVGGCSLWPSLLGFSCLESSAFAFIIGSDVAHPGVEPLKAALVMDHVMFHS